MLLLEIIDPFIYTIIEAEELIVQDIIQIYQKKDLHFFNEIYLYEMGRKEGPRKFLKLF